MVASITWNSLLLRNIQPSGISLFKCLWINSVKRNIQLVALSRCLSGGLNHHHRHQVWKPTELSSTRFYSDSVKQEKSKIVATEEEDELYKSIEIRVKGHDESVLDSYEMFVSMAAKELNVTLDNITKPKKHIKRLSLLKSPFIHKKHFVQYEMRTHYRVMLFKHLTGSTASVFLEYIQRNLPEGVAMKVTKCAIERMPEYIKPPSDADLDQLVTGLDRIKV